MFFMIKTVNNATSPVEHALAMGIDMPLSPFGLRENEKAVPVVIERDNGKFTSPYEAEFLVSVGIIGEDEIHLLEVVNNFVVISLNQLHSALNLEGIDITRNKLISNVKKLIKYRFLQAVRFENGINTKSGYILALDNNGSLLLRSRHRDDGVHVRFVGYFKSMDAYKLKKNLAANQLVLNLFGNNGVQISDFCKGQLLKDSHDIDRTNVIRSECRFTYSDNDCFVESIRRNPEWEDKLSKKLGYYHDLFNLPEGRLNIRTENPLLILIAEDEFHCEEVMRIASEAKHRNIAVTCDKFTYKLTPDNAFFKPQEGKKDSLFSKLKLLLKAS